MVDCLPRVRFDTGDGETFLFVANPAKTRFSGIATRYTWSGGQLSQVAGPKVFVSPRGDYVATMAPIAVREDGQAAPWYTFNAFDMADGSPMFRVVGATPYFGFWAGNRWLADGSGLVVERPDQQLVLALRDGSFRDFRGLPSPDSLDIFGIYGGAVDAEGNSIVSVTFEGGISDFVDPWGDGGDEVRLVVPHGGHGGPGFTASIVVPHVEEAPYAGAPQLQLSEIAAQSGLLNLYDEPAGANVVGILAAPYTVTVLEVVTRCSGDSFANPEECPVIDSPVQSNFLTIVTDSEAWLGRPLTGYWARVTGPDGQEGWILLQVSPQGI